MQLNKKAQTAMEYLISYGWAALIVIIVLVALIIFGVLMPDRAVPDMVDLGDPRLIVQDATVDEKTVSFVLVNDFDKSLEDVIITV